MIKEFNEQPFLQFFRTPSGQRYVYDVNRNSFFEIDEITDSVLQLWRSGVRDSALLPKLQTNFPIEALKSSLHTVRLWAKKGYLSHHRPQQFRFPFTGPEICDQLNGHIQQIILCVTENCNLRCRYCVYSGSYKGYRGHSSIHMPESTALKALSFFLRHSELEPLGHVSFYGGEPLLHFDLVRTCVAYCNSEHNGKTIHFNLTTNGTLLNESVMDFLVANNFGLRVSLDGPASVHDANRIFRNGAGTHQRVMANLTRFKARHPDYFQRKVSLISVVGWPYDLQSAYHFFQTDKTVSGLLPSVEGVIRRNTSYFDSRPAPSENIEMLSQLEDAYCRLMAAQEPIPPYLASLFQRRMAYLAKRDAECLLDDDRYPNGICIPGVRRLFVTASGRFQACEKFSDGLYIGDIANGFDVAAIQKMLADYVEICRRNCRNCWAQRLCTACFVSCNGQGIDEERKTAFCIAERRQILNSFIMYFRILEQNPEAFATLKKIEWD